MKMKVEIVVEATGVAESIVEGQVDMIDVAVLYEKALTAVMEKPGIVDLEVLVFDQAIVRLSLRDRGNLTLVQLVWKWSWRR